MFLTFYLLDEESPYCRCLAIMWPHLDFIAGRFPTSNGYELNTLSVQSHQHARHSSQGNGDHVRYAPDFA
jgi:hypothetical protein